MTGLPARAALVAFALPAALAACTPGDGPPSPGPVTPRTLTVIADAPPAGGWDPATAHGPSGALNDVYETLTRYDSTSHQVAPLLATEWEPNRDHTVWRFSLRDGVRFHSGRPMDATAVRAAILDSARRSPASAWHDVRAVATPNNGTVTVTLDRPLPLADLAAADHGAFVYDVRAVRAAHGAPGADAGTGPYRVAAWRPRAATPLRLTRAPGYWRGWKNGQFTDVAYTVERGGRGALRRLRASGYAIALRLPPATWAGLRGEEGVQTSQVPSWRNLLALLDTHRLDDPGVRRAISYGIDGDRLVSALHGALAAPSGVVPEGLYGHFADLPMYAHDPGRARALLATAGSHRPRRLTLRYDDAPGLGDAARRVAADLRGLGIRVDVRHRGPAAGAQDIAVVRRSPNGPDPYGLFAATFAAGAPGNLGRYSDRAFDRLISGARATAATDQDAAAQAYRRAQMTLLHDAPAVFLGTELDQRAFRTDFTGYDDDPAYPDTVFAYDLTARAP